MQKRNPEQDKWIIQTELPYHRLTLVNSDAANQIAVLLADGNTYGNKYVVRKEVGKWVIPSKDERCIYPMMVYGVKYPMVVHGIKEVVTQTPIPNIPWRIIDPVYNHAAMDGCGTVWWYDCYPKFVNGEDEWVPTDDKYIRSPLVHNLTGVVPALSLTSRPE